MWAVWACLCLDCSWYGHTSLALFRTPNVHTVRLKIHAVRLKMPRVLVTQAKHCQHLTTVCTCSRHSITPQAGMSKMSEEFKKAGAEIYH